MCFDIRTAQPDDAPAISAVIVTALRISNARDYSPEVIARVVQHFSPECIEALIATRQVLVAMQDRQLFGTASLEGTSKNYLRCHRSVKNRLKMLIYSA
jgi:hypothetical protein